MTEQRKQQVSNSFDKFMELQNKMTPQERLDSSEKYKDAPLAKAIHGALICRQVDDTTVIVSSNKNIREESLEGASLLIEELRSIPVLTGEVAERFIDRMSEPPTDEEKAEAKRIREKFKDGNPLLRTGKYAVKPIEENEDDENS